MKKYRILYISTWWAPYMQALQGFHKRRFTSVKRLKDKKNSVRSPVVMSYVQN